MAKLKDRRMTVKDFQKLGLAVVPGRVYVRKEWLPKRRLSLEALHRKLATFHGSLADEVGRARDEG